MKYFGKTLLTTAAIAMWTAMFPSVLPAQTSGVGCDGYTRFMWRGTDGRIALWTLTPGLAYSNSTGYGPYDGWTPIAMTVLCNNYTYVLWKYTDGTISLWKVAPNLSFVTSAVYGPYAGWIPESLSPDQASPGSFRVLWRETQGYISIWDVNSNLGFVGNAIYGPYFGYDPGNASATTTRLNLSTTVDAGSVDAAAAAMARPAGTPMPH